MIKRDTFPYWQAPRKGSLPLFGTRIYEQNAFIDLNHAVAAVLESDDGCDDLIKRAKALLKVWRRYGTDRVIHPKEPRPIEQLVKLELISDDLLSADELELLECMAFERRSYGQRHGKSRL